VPAAAIANPRTKAAFAPREPREPRAPIHAAATAAKLGRLIDDALFLPDEVRTTLDRAEELLDHGDPAGAETAIEAVLRERPDHPRVLTLHARARRGLGDLSGALQLLRRAASIDPSDPETCPRTSRGRRRVTLDRGQ
jgi:Flp pilus assembly protein TadD